MVSDASGAAKRRCNLPAPATVVSYYADPDGKGGLRYSDARMCLDCARAAESEGYRVFTRPSDFHARTR